MATLISHSPAETRAIGELWGREAREGWIITLTGDLGAGKTQLVKGLAVGLGSPARVQSPTFALLNIYEGGRLLVHHMDLYRLENAEQVQAAGLCEYLGKGVTVIEWAERLWHEGKTIGAPGQLVRAVRMEVIDDTDRQLTYEDIGA